MDAPLSALVEYRVRFWARVVKAGRQDCWLWRLVCDRDGYGRFSVLGRRRPAHRAAWMLAHNQEIPPDKVIRHSCDNPRCCNPAHLLFGTQLENIQDRVERGRSAFGRIPRFTEPIYTGRLEPVSRQTDARASVPVELQFVRMPRSDRSVSEIVGDLMRKKSARKAGVG